MPRQARLYSSAMQATRRSITRCSVAEKSRPSMRVWNLPEPPNSESMTANTMLGSQTIRPEPRSGRTCMMLKLVGTTISRRKALYFCTLMPPMETSGLLRIMLNSPTRMLRAKRSLMISMVGMRPRTMRSWLARSYGGCRRSAPLPARASGFRR
jgi:hypothetical protein